MQDRAELLHQNFLERVASGDLPEIAGDSLEASGLSAERLTEIFESQLLSRHLDYHSRVLQARGESFYTIGSAGHEGNAAIAAAFRANDMAFLHYRDGAFFIQRSKLVAGQNPLYDMLLSFVASSDDPISGGRHKVLGSKALFIPPQTSTIASHLPKAIGAATSIGLNKRRKQEGVLASDGVVLCSFGDASINHSTAQGAINTASWMGYQKMHLPLVFICEDNGIGISTPTPEGWVHASMQHKPGIRYFSCNGLDIVETYRVACEVEAYVRTQRMPAFLHMRCIRLLGHAGADAQHVYLSEQAIEETEAHDPLLYSASHLVARGIMNPQQILALYHRIAAEVAREAEEAITRPKLASAAEVMASIVPDARNKNPPKKPTQHERATLFSGDEASISRPQNMARLINWALADLMLENESIVLAGEDIGPKGGVYAVTTKLHARFGSSRVINTLLDEQTILGLAIGMAHNDILPIPEIQFLAYLHNAEDQLRGEAATLSFFSRGQFTNPMVIRIAGLAYQRGFGGHFHNDNSVAVIRDIPGVILACPSNGADAVGMLRECVRLARDEQRVVVFLEPIALYMMRDLHAPKDSLWCFDYEEALQRTITIGDIAQHNDGKELCILSYGNGYFLSRQAEKELAETHGIAARVIDIRWLSPLPEAEILRAVSPCAHVLIVDECRISGSASEALYTMLHERLPSPPKIARIAAEDSFIPLGKAATITLPSKASIMAAALVLMGKA